MCVSVQISSELWRRKDLSANAKFLFAWIESVSSEGGKFNYDIADVAKELGISKRYAYKLYTELSNLGLIELKPNRLQIEQTFTIVNKCSQNGTNVQNSEQMFTKLNKCSQNGTNVQNPQQNAVQGGFSAAGDKVLGEFCTENKDFLGQKSEDLQNFEKERSKERDIIYNNNINNLNNNNIYNNINNNLNKNLNKNLTTKEKEKEKEKEKPKNFKKPTIAEIDEYCRERKNGIDAEAFFAFYESKGWKVGSSAMKDWKMAVITWEKRGKAQGVPKYQKHAEKKSNVMDLADKLGITLNTGLKGDYFYLDI